MLSTLRAAAWVILAALPAEVIASSALPAAHPYGQMAEEQIRHIATWFPGRMAGSPAEMLTADYLRQQFEQMGYHSDTRDFKTRYAWHESNGQTVWHHVTARSTIAARTGEAPQEIVIVAHLDTWTPQSDADNQKNLGGLRLQGVDDNASGLGVMLELAQRLQPLSLHYSLRFVAISGEEIGQRGTSDYIARMTAQEKKNVLLVIDLDSLIVGDRLYFDSGRTTPAPVVKQTRDRALAIAHRYGIKATRRPDNARDGFPANPFEQAGFPLLLVRATNWALGNQDGLQQRAVSPHFPHGTTRYQTEYDNLLWIDHWLPGRITARARNSVRILLPLIIELANPGKKEVK
ncbi:aminopeptidase [Paramixta manurensis]|uniref:Aminopeptidase n=1 Tax=Paramixta manurensis TaxID=2740817 RepID=A0A6M8UTM4_9GAMM|nr:aminopeptidase [Erwiniaceae bacterium PD-1]